jgi:hypothetical protein
MYGSDSYCALWRYADGAGAWYGVVPDFDYYSGGQDGGWNAMQIINDSTDATLSSPQLSSWANLLQ